MAARASRTPGGAGWAPASLSLLAGLVPEDSLGAGKVVSIGGLSTGTLPKNFSLTDMAKLDAPTELDMQMKG